MRQVFSVPGKRKARSIVLVASGLAVLFASVGGCWISDSVVALLRDRLFDRFQSFHADANANSSVAIVAIDERSLDRLGQWPWPRRIHADLVRRLAGMGAAVIAFDVVFAEPDRSGPENDIALVDAVSSAPVVLGQLGDDVPGAGGPSRTVRVSGDLNTEALPRIGSIVGNLPDLEAAASGAGLALVAHGRDGIARSLPALFFDGRSVHPSFVLEVLRVAAGRDDVTVWGDGDGVREIGVVKGFNLPVDGSGRLFPRFSQEGQRTVVSAVDVLDGTVPESLIRNRIVLIGGTAQGLQDLEQTPLGRTVPGVAVHADGIESALSRSLPHRPRAMPTLERLVALGIGVVLVVGMMRLSTAWSAGLWIGLLGAAWGLSWTAFGRYGVLFDPVPALIGLTTVFMAMVVARLVFAERAAPRP